ncbi:AraC family transcriptional regulator [Aquimarina sp. AU474]|uniref:helix-turn-helix domain-containing protein n=1 Tax=Aquimarina sp. AU474 TaxID=2108529 RepID=UPI000D68DF48|nr:helix-turn-helix domain-containing protein [Aquimarina sp. AU474]
MKKTYALLFLFLFYEFSAFAFQGTIQNRVHDSLLNKTFEELNTSLARSMNDTITFKKYAKAILIKGKKERDTTQILNGFYFLSIINTDQDIVFQYMDSVINIGKKVKNDRFVGMSFLNKGRYLYTKRKFNPALDNFLNAKKYLKNFSKPNYFNEHNIGVLKSRIGDYVDAHKIFKENWEIINKSKTNFTNNSYLRSLFSLADSYHRIKEFDSTTYYNSLGINQSLRFNNQIKYYQFVLNEGINQYHLENYTASHDSVFKVLNDFKNKLDIPNLIFAYQYCGKNLMKRKNEDGAIVCFKKVDSLFNVINDIHPETRDSYEYLINYYKSKNDLPNQLKYVTQLLKVDSILNTNNQYLGKKIAKLYDTPKLIEEKEIIINKLESKNSATSNRLFIVLGLLAISTIGLFYLYRRQKILKKRFLNLVQKEDNNARQVNDLGINKSKIPDEVVTDILSKLELFEKSDRFLDASITLNDLAKQFDTNSKYLSKTINTYKNKNFSVYINELRVHYGVEKIKNDSKFRNYTIKAISNEIGFNTTQAFSKAFHKTTGIYPSYFIRNVEKLMDKN